MATTIAVDVAKSVFEVAVSERPGRVRERHRLTRRQFSRFVSTRGPATVVLEACSSAHFWGRHARAHGHEAILLPPHAVRPYVQRNKTDRTDTLGILEAKRNEAIHPVPVKSVEQQALASLHSLRSTWVSARTARLNTVRGLLLEFGIPIPMGANNVVPRVRALVATEDPAVPESLRPALVSAADEIGELERRLQEVELQIAAIARQTPAVARLQTIPGVGVLTATALYTLIGDPHRFPTGRHLASYLGLTPKEHSSGERHRLGAISKRGDPYVRMRLVNGARSALLRAKRRSNPGRLERWALSVERNKGHNKAVLALANRMARIAWAVWAHDEPFLDRDEKDSDPQA